MARSDFSSPEPSKATAEQEERWDDARMLKLQDHQHDLLNPTGDEIDAETPIDPQLEQRIRQAEEAGDYDESLRLKSQALGITP